MEQDLDTAHSLVHVRSVSHISFQDLQRVAIKSLHQLLNVLAFARAEIVQYADRMPILQKGLDDMRPNKASAASNKNVHFTSRFAGPPCRSCAKLWQHPYPGSGA